MCYNYIVRVNASCGHVQTFPTEKYEYSKVSQQFQLLTLNVSQTVIKSNQ